MSLVEIVLGLAAFATAVGILWIVVKKAWAAFGWHGKFWAWMGRFISTVDVIAVLPQRFEVLSAKDQEKLDAIAKVRTDLLAADEAKLQLITEVKQTLDAHIEETRVGREEWDAMKGTLHKLVATADAIQYEVKNNGGGSLKDQAARIERGVQGLYASPGEIGSPGREDHRESPATGVSGPNLEIRAAVRARRGRKNPNPPTSPIPVIG